MRSCLPTPMSSSGWRAVSVLFFGLLRRSQRKEDLEARALAGGALHLDVPAMARDDAVADRQTQTGPFAHRLGREERVEEARQIFGRDAAAVIGDLDEKLIADAATGETNATAFRPSRRFDSLNRVDQQVEQNLADLGA